MSLCYQSEHHRGNAATGEISAVLAGAPTYAMALDWDYRACAALAGLMIRYLAGVSIFHHILLGTDHNNYVQPSPAIKLHFEIFIALRPVFTLPARWVLFFPSLCWLCPAWVQYVNTST